MQLIFFKFTFETLINNIHNYNIQITNILLLQI